VQVRDWTEVDRLAALERLDELLLVGNPLYNDHKDNNTLPEYRVEVSEASTSSTVFGCKLETHSTVAVEMSRSCSCFCEQRAVPRAEVAWTSALHSVHCTVCTAQCALHSVHCTVCTAQCARTNVSV
jgi:hypothetical protein